MDRRRPARRMDLHLHDAAVDHREKQKRVLAHPFLLKRRDDAADLCIKLGEHRGMSAPLLTLEHVPTGIDRRLRNLQWLHHRRQVAQRANTQRRQVLADTAAPPSCRCAGRLALPRLQFNDTQSRFGWSNRLLLESAGTRSRRGDRLRAAVIGSTQNGKSRRDLFGLARCCDWI